MSKIYGNPTTNSFARIPIIPLSYADKNKAVERELIVDYSTGKLYIVSATDRTQLIDVTSQIAEILKEEGFNVDALKVTVEGEEINLDAAIADIIYTKLDKEKLGESLKIEISDLSITVIPESTGNMSVARSGHGGVASSNQFAIAFGGHNSDTNTEFYNDGLWSSIGSYPFVYKYSGVVGTIEDYDKAEVISIGGMDSSGNATDRISIFSNNNWKALTPTAVPMIYPMPIMGLGCVGDTKSTILAFGGRNNDSLDGVVESVIIEPVIGNYHQTTTTNYPIYGMGSFGNVYNAFSVAGYSDSHPINNVMQYNGYSWLEAGNLNAARGNVAAFGSSNFGVVTGGLIPGGTIYSGTEIFNGYSWYYNATNITPRYEAVAAGSIDGGLLFGGITSDNTATNSTELLNINLSTNNKMDKINTRISDNILTTSITGNAKDSGISILSLMQSTSMDNPAISVDTWSQGPELTLARTSAGDAGTSDAALVFGGDNGDMSDDEDAFLEGSTEMYNGQTWSDTGHLLNIARCGLAGSGTINNAIAVSGFGCDNEVETYNGIGWSLANPINIRLRMDASVIGNSNSAIVVAGNSSEKLNSSELYDGNTWSLGASLNIARFGHASCGDSINNVFVYGGNIGTYDCTDSTEQYNGFVWAISENLNTARGYLSGCKTKGAIYAFGGHYTHDSPTTIVDKYNGLTWFTTTNLLNPRSSESSTGGENSLVFAGSNNASPVLSSMEVLTVMNMVEHTTTEDQWTIGSELISAVRQNAGCGNINATLSFGGLNTSNSSSTITELFNGDIWSQLSNLNEARRRHTGCGNTNAALTFGGYHAHTNSEMYNGISWSTIAGLLLNREELASCGNAVAALAIGGAVNSKSIASTEMYNGATWSESANLNEARRGNVGCGNTVAGLTVGSSQVTDTINQSTNSTEKFNGTTWSILPANINRSRVLGGLSGLSNNALLSNGRTGITLLSTCEKFDGNTWSTLSVTVNNPRRWLGASGTADNALTFGGDPDDSASHYTEIFRAANINLIGKVTEDGGQIFNDYENNKALSKFSTATGQGNTAGMRAFRILEKGPFDVDDLTAHFRLDSIEGLETGDVYSLCLGDVWNDLGVIEEIIRADGKYYVRVSNFPENGVLVSDKQVEEKPWENTLSINDKPHIGTVSIGFGATANGLETIALRVGSHTSGYKTKAIWIGSDAGGIRTFANFAAMARGVDCEAIGYYSYAGGTKCKVYCSRGFAHGISLESSKNQSQALFGQYNKVDDEALFGIGNGVGSDDEYRNNAFVVKKDGRAVLGASPKEDMDAANKKYVDREISTISNSITNTNSKINVLEERTITTTQCYRTITTDTGSVNINDIAPFSHKLEVSVSGGDNIVSQPYDDTNTKNGRTINGITFTVNDDGSIRAKGTATGLASFVVKKEFETKTGSTYLLSGLPEEGFSGGSIVMYLRNSADTGNYLCLSTGNESNVIAYNASTTSKTRFQISVRQGTVIDAVFNPIITEAPKYIDIAPVVGATLIIQYKPNSKNKLVHTIQAYSSRISINIRPNGYKYTTSVTYIQKVSDAIDSRIADLVNSAPETLNTLNELAEALGDDPNFATTMTNELARKANKDTTLSGYGITDAYTKSQTDSKIAAGKVAEAKGLTQVCRFDANNAITGFVKFAEIAHTGYSTECGCTLHIVQRYASDSYYKHIDAYVTVCASAEVDTAESSGKFYYIHLEQIAGEDITNRLMYVVGDHKVSFYILRHKDQQNIYATTDNVINPNNITFFSNAYDDVASEEQLLALGGVKGTYCPVQPNAIQKSVSLNNTNLNNVVESGFYRIQSGCTNVPNNYQYCQMIVSRGGDTALQIISHFNQSKISYRVGVLSDPTDPKWFDWVEGATKIDLESYAKTTDVSSTYAKKATKLSGYGITDAYTKTEVQNTYATKSELTSYAKTTDLGTMAKETSTNYVKKSEASGYNDILTKTSASSTYAKKATTLSGYGITNAYTKTETDSKITAGKVAEAMAFTPVWKIDYDTTSNNNYWYKVLSCQKPNTTTYAGCTLHIMNRYGNPDHSNHYDALVTMCFSHNNNIFYPKLEQIAGKDITNKLQYVVETDGSISVYIQKGQYEHVFISTDGMQVRNTEITFVTPSNNNAVESIENGTNATYYSQPLAKKATSDADGNVISSTYAKKSDLSALEETVSNLDLKKVFNNITFSEASWTYDNELSLYKYTYVNQDVSTNSLVNINFKLESLAYAEFVGIVAETYDGGVYLYSDEEVTEDLVADIIII